MSSTSAAPRRVKLSTAGETYDLHPRTLRRMIAQGRLTGYSTGRTIFVDPRELDALFKRIAVVEAAS